MQRFTSILAVGILVVTAGCSGVPLLDSDQRQSPTEPRVSSTPNHTQTTTNIQQSSQINTDEIVLRLSDTGFGYTFSSESIEYKNNVSSERKNRFEEKGILKQHTRIFTLESQNSGGKPTLIRSTVVIYENKEDAEKDLQNVLDTFEEQGSNVSKVQIASGITTDQVKFENERGLKNIIFYKHQQKMLYYIVVSDQKQYYEQEARDLFTEMIVNIK